MSRWLLVGVSVLLWKRRRRRAADWRGRSRFCLMSEMLVGVGEAGLWAGGADDYFPICIRSRGGVGTRVVLCGDPGGKCAGDMSSAARWGRGLAGDGRFNVVTVPGVLLGIFALCHERSAGGGNLSG